MEEPLRPRRALLQLGRERGEKLEPSGRELPAEAELRGRARHTGREERLRLVGGETGEPRAVTAGEPVAARRAAHRLDRNTRRGERLHVPVDGPHRHLEPLGDVSRRQLPASLQEQQERDQPGRAHESDPTSQT